ncbi:MAG: TetR/AcrR family transcriptional regulator [Phycisphaerae bacterium]
MNETEQTSGSHPAASVPLDVRGSYDDRLNHILEAATATIARLGYARASMREVAKAAGVSLAGIYHYFDSKEKMLFLIQFRTFGSLLSNLREKVCGVDDPEAALRIMIRAHLAYFAANMGALKVCSHELDSLSGSAYDETRSIRLEYYALTRDIVDRLLDARGSNGSIDRHVTTMALFGTLNWLYRWYDPQRGPAVNTVADQITDQFLHGILRRVGAKEHST